MCGLAGLISWDAQCGVARPTLQAMAARINHRGPDSQNLTLNLEGPIQVGLSHARLAIIDLDPRADQPMTDGRGRWLVYNGEIYNYRKVRSELEALLPEFRWQTTCDTEVILAAWEAWGPDCVERFSGMFAFALWDGARSELFLARDRMGQKPLYFATLPSNYGHGLIEVDDVPTRAVAFASELPALLEVPWVDRAIGRPELEEYLRYGYVHGGGTIYRGVAQLPPGCWTIIGAQGRRSARYFRPSDAALASTRGGLDWRRPPSDAEAVRLTRTYVLGAVQEQLIADVPVGCFLSGGIDSSIVAAAMKLAAGSSKSSPPVMTFSIGFEDPRYDESEFARRVAAHLGTQHHAFVARPDAAADLPKIAAAFGEPFGDSSALPTHYLAQQTRPHVKVALSGDGGDELFGGYERYRAMRLGQRLRTLLTPWPWKLLRKMLGDSAGGHPKSRRTRFGRLARSLADPPGVRYASYLRFFSDPMLDRLLIGGPESSYDPVLAILENHLARLPVVPRCLAADRETYLPGDLLAKVDRCSMLYALEVRSPFMDHQLVEFAATLSTSQLLRGGGKRMLREAFLDLLPDWVFTRPKMGFAVPIGEWFRTSLRSMLREHLFAADSFARANFEMPFVEQLIREHESEQIDHSQRLYALLMLELWWQPQR